jgi:hypothetical protein
MKSCNRHLVAFNYDSKYCLASFLNLIDAVWDFGYL